MSNTDHIVTVKEMIDLLSQFDGDKQVVVQAIPVLEDDKPYDQKIVGLKLRERLTNPARVAVHILTA